MINATCVFHVEGDQNDVLFTVPDVAYSLAEGDTFVYTDETGTTNYKVEKAEYQLEYGASPNPETFGRIRKGEKVYFGLSVVI